MSLSKLAAILIITFSTNSLMADSNCEHLIGDCAFYLCMDELIPCEKDNYNRKFGYKYCTKYKNKVRKKLSPDGKAWLRRNEICLQEDMSYANIDNLTCKEYETLAIRMHTPCFYGTRFCELSRKDKRKINYAAISNVVHPKYLSEGLRVLKQCR